MSTAADANAPVGVDPTRASVARVYDYLLGGKDHYEIDRRTARELTEVMPDIVETAIENRAFLIRAVRFIARQTDIVQYLDCGSGLPTAENVHQVAQRLNPESKIVYVDHDPVVLAHGRALLEENELTRFVSGDIFRPRTILEDPTVAGHLDWNEPIALFQVASLHHHRGARSEPAQVMREYIKALPPGSYVVISHAFDPEDPEGSQTAKELEETIARGSMGDVTWRNRAEIAELFDGLEMIDPGVVPIVNWWPDGPHLKPLTVAHRIVAGGVGRKP